MTRENFNQALWYFGLGAAGTAFFIFVGWHL